MKLLIEVDPEFSNYTKDAQKPRLYLVATKGFFGIAERILYVFSSSSSHVGANGMTALHAAVDFKYPGNYFTWFKPLIFRLLIHSVLYITIIRMY